MQSSQKMHTLLITGPAGFGKSTAVDEALRLAGAKAVHLGSYSSPLNLFNFLHEHSDEGVTVVIDDTSGIYSDPAAMAILKAATWAQGGPRVVRWGSTSGKASVSEFEFKGKVVIACNSFPTSSDANAVRSRSFPYEFNISEDKARELLKAAAQSPKWFSDPVVAGQVADFLCRGLNQKTLPHISYRTLQMGYELANHNPEDWEMLLGRMVAFDAEDPRLLIKKLSKEGISVGEQLERFERVTGLRRRTFFKYRQELKISGRS